MTGGISRRPREVFRTGVHSAPNHGECRTMKNLPIVCTLTPETMATRKAQLLPGLFRRAATTEATLEGYRLRFDSSAGTLHTVVSAVEAERHCCRFLRFELAVEPDEGSLVLTLSGPPGAREFLEALCDV